MKKLAFFFIFTLLLAAPHPANGSTAEEAAVYEITIDYTFTNSSSNTATDLTATIYLFDNWSGWIEQEVLSENVTLDGTPIQLDIHDDPDNRWAEVDLGSLAGGQTKTLQITQLVKVKTVRFSINLSQVGTEIPSELQEYTQPVDDLFESDDPGIQSLVAELTAGLTNPYFKAERIFNWVVDNITYIRQVQEHSALYAYQSRTGDCTEFTNLIVAMCRAAGIPAKAVSGEGFLTLYSISGETVDFNAVGHAWAIIYLPNYGWIPVDGTWPQGTGSFGELTYEHIAGATTGGDGVVQDGDIKWPGPGQASASWQYIQGKPASITIGTSGTVAPRVLLTLEATASSQIQTDGTLDFTVTVKNRGTTDASGVSVQLEVDPNYFENVTPSAQKTTLASGEEWSPTLTVKVKDNAYGENHDITVRATYSSSYDGIGGTFSSVGKTKLNIPPKPSEILVFDYTTLALLGVLAAAAGALAGAIARRR